MIIRKAEYLTTAVTLLQYPPDDRPEIAFVGRSNVGKSSLINSMLNRKGLARTSGQPGKTRTINFYNINDILYFVDLPGYGYAKTSKSSRDSWGVMIENYLYNRKNVVDVVLLLDIRHEPSSDDILMYNWIKSYNKKVTLAITKCDKISKGQYQKHVSIIRKTLQIQKVDELVLFSSETKEGRVNLWSLFDNILGIDEPFKA